MADYRTITDAEVDPDAPLTSSLGYAWRDNPIAIAEGATGAPRIVDAALNAGSVTNNGGTFVGNRMANVLGRSGFPVGTVVFAATTTLGVTNYNDIVSGGVLRPAGVNPNGVLTISPNYIGTGNWVCLGYAVNTSAGEVTATIFCRVS